MEVQSVCRGLQLPKFKSSNCGFLSHQFVSKLFSRLNINFTVHYWLSLFKTHSLHFCLQSTTFKVSPSASQFGSRSQSIRFGNAYKCTVSIFNLNLLSGWLGNWGNNSSLSVLGNTFPNLKHKIEGYSAWSSKRGAILCASNSGSDTKLGFPSGENSSLPVAIFNGPEPFRGKSGSVSFCGLTHQLVEEGKLMSAPFQEDKGSFLWILAPVVLISSLILPQMFLGNVIEDFIKDNLLMGIS